MIVSLLTDLTTGKSARVWGPTLVALIALGWLLWQAADST